MPPTCRITAAPIRRALLAWFDAERRDLPWRATRDPYAIWVSEVMLQQTQAARVVEYWPRFLAAFPSVAALAAAAVNDVFAVWSGLGYYRRARMLHEAAAVIAARGAFPRGAVALRALPGVGEYTAAAVASIAHGEVIPAIDANARRVLGRLLGVRVGGTGGRASAIRALARNLIDPSRPGDWNQAVMELGALVCLPAVPRCSACPVRRFCSACRSGSPESYGSARKGTGTVRCSEAVAAIVRRGRILLVRGPSPRGWWSGLWMLPRAEVAGAAGGRGLPKAPHAAGGRLLPEAGDPAAARRLLAEKVRRELGVSCAFAPRPVAFRYSVTRHRVAGLAYRAVSVAGTLRRESQGRWFGLDEAAAEGLPAPDRRVLEVLRSARRPPSPATPRARRRRRAGRRSKRQS